MHVQAAHAIPVNALDNEAFRAFCRALRVDFNMPGTTAFNKRKDALYARMKVRMVQRVGGWKVAAMVVDGWKNYQHTETLGCTVLPVGPDDKPLLLDIEQQFCRQTAMNIVGFMERMMNTIKAQGASVVACITDNAANMGAALDTLEAKCGLIKLNCLAHSGVLFGCFPWPLHACMTQGN